MLIFPVTVCVGGVPLQEPVVVPVVVPVGVPVVVPLPPVDDVVTPDLPPVAELFPEPPVPVPVPVLVPVSAPVGVSVLPPLSQPIASRVARTVAPSPLIRIVVITVTFPERVRSLAELVWLGKTQSSVRAQGGKNSQVLF
jgi:hypothetical protein